MILLRDGRQHDADGGCEKAQDYEGEHGGGDSESETCPVCIGLGSVWVLRGIVTAGDGVRGVMLEEWRGLIRCGWRCHLAVREATRE